MKGAVGSDNTIELPIPALLNKVHTVGGGWLDQLAKFTQRIPGLLCTIQLVSIDSNTRANRCLLIDVPKKQNLGSGFCGSHPDEASMRNSAMQAVSQGC